MSSYYVDTSIWVVYAKGSSETVRELIESSILFSSDVVLMEFADVFTRLGIPQKKILESVKYIANKATIVKVTPEISVEGAHIKKEQRKKKPKFGVVDGIHLATAREVNAILLTKDKDFSGLKGVQIVG